MDEQTSAPEKLDLALTVVLRQDGDVWYAQALQYDIGSQGRTVDEAKRHFMHTLAAEIFYDLEKGYYPLSELPQAPRRYFEASVSMKADGPELPVFVPYRRNKRVNARAAFLQQVQLV